MPVNTIVDVDFIRKLSDVFKKPFGRSGYNSHFLDVLDEENLRFEPIICEECRNTLGIKVISKKNNQFSAVIISEIGSIMIVLGIHPDSHSIICNKYGKSNTDIMFQTRLFLCNKCRVPSKDFLIPIALISSAVASDLKNTPIITTNMPNFDPDLGCWITILVAKENGDNGMKMFLNLQTNYKEFRRILSIPALREHMKRFI